MGKGRDRDYGDCEEIVDAVMDMIAKRWTKSMIKRDLREWFPGLTASSAQWIITQAKRKICKIYNIDPQEYKGKQIAFYELILRGGDKTHDKLTAAERLDKLLGLEHISIEDPALIAAKIVAFKRAIDISVEGQKDGGNKNDGSRQDEKDDSGADERSNGAGGEGSQTRNESSQEKAKLDKEQVMEDSGIEEDNGITPEDPEIKANIDDVLKKQSGYE